MRIVFTKSATEDLERLDASIRRRVFEKLDWMSRNRDTAPHIPLGFRLKGFFKLRVGDWRIVYELDLTSDANKTRGISGLNSG